MSDERATRLAEQLRANLLRRKGQRRARHASEQPGDLPRDGARASEGDGRSDDAD